MLALCPHVQSVPLSQQPVMPPSAVPSLAVKKPSPEAKPRKKKSPVKKLAIKADYGGVSFGEAAIATDRGQEEEEEQGDDPLASYRQAAAAAAKALEKERKQEAQRALFRKIFVAMDTDGDGVVSMGEMVEAVAAGTAPLSHRASQPSSRPTGAVPLQLPMQFSLAHWEKEMIRALG